MPARAIPSELRLVLHENPRARTAFNALPKSHQAEYSKWIAEAKKPETRTRRAKEAMKMMEARPKERSASAG